MIPIDVRVLFEVHFSIMWKAISAMNDEKQQVRILQV
jgi:hypothetical protein